MIETHSFCVVKGWFRLEKDMQVKRYLIQLFKRKAFRYSKRLLFLNISREIFFERSEVEIRFKNPKRIINLFRILEEIQSCCLSDHLPLHDNEH